MTKFVFTEIFYHLHILSPYIAKIVLGICANEFNLYQYKSKLTFVCSAIENINFSFIDEIYVQQDADQKHICYSLAMMVNYTHFQLNKN